MSEDWYNEEAVGFIYSCDVCGKPKDELHFIIAYGIDTYVCDDCIQDDEPHA